LEVWNKVNGVHLGKMFGADCLRASNGKVVAIYWQESMLFKLDEETRLKALEIQSATPATHLYAKDRAMRGWVNIPFTSSEHWESLTIKAIAQSSQRH